MSSLATEFVRGVRVGGLLGPGDRVVAAVSGGGDSVALLHLLAETGPRTGAALAGVVHLHHGLRGAAADEDLDCVRGHAAALGVALHVERADVAALARARGQSVEAAGRAAREACYERARQALGATHVATGHTVEDQAETVLLRLSRGAGLGALAGIRRMRDHVVRPLLGLRRGALREYLAGRGLGWREDTTNADTRLARNRVRHRVMPVLEAELSPRVAEALARTAGIAAEEDELLRDLTNRAAGPVRVLDAQAGALLDRAALLSLPGALRRRLVHDWLQQSAPSLGLAMAHVEAVLAVAAGPGEGARVSLPGRTVVVDGGRIRVEAGGWRRGRRADSANSTAGPCRLPVPGVLSLAGLGLQLSADRLPAAPPGLVEAGAARLAGGEAAVVDAEAAGEMLAVRFRRPGDRLRPLGMTGHRKLQDVLVDRKVPREARDRVPLVVDARDRIVWVAGHVISADVRVTAGTTRVLLLQLQRSGGVV